MWRFFYFLIFSTITFYSRAQTTRVELLNSVPSQKMARGLGVNVHSADHLVFAKDLGATEVRAQFAWVAAEDPYKNLKLHSKWKLYLDKCKELGLNPLIVAGYGSPYFQVADIIVSKDTEEGSLEIPVCLTTKQTNFKLQPPYDLVSLEHRSDLADGKIGIVEKGSSYAGSLVKKSVPSNIKCPSNTIALNLNFYSPTRFNLPVNTPLRVHRYLYNPPLTNDENDPSVKAYVRYVNYLANEMYSRGLSGRVEIWNEPIWVNDMWDSLGCFDPSSKCLSPNYGFAKALLKQRPKGKIRFQWGGTHKSGFSSILGKGVGRVVNKDEILNSLVSESFHPYGPTPEWHAWDPKCIVNPQTSNIFEQCLQPGTNATSNFKWAAALAEKNKIAKGWTINQNISEIGIWTANERIRTRYSLRAYLTYMGLGYENVNFYTLIDKKNEGYSFSLIDDETKKPSEAFYALKNLINKFKTLPEKSLNTPGDIPAVKSYTGQWPLMIVPVVGRKSSREKVDTVQMFLWQRTYPNSIDDSKTVGDTFDTVWQNLPSPKPGTVTLTTKNTKTVKAWRTIDWIEIPIKKINDLEYQLGVQEDPIIVEFSPN
jgi:hypothetical protein